jgi:hypothetical protein
MCRCREIRDHVRALGGIRQADPTKFGAAPGAEFWDEATEA